MSIPSDHAHNRWHPGLEPVASVGPGEEITLETQDGLGGQLTRASTHADVAGIDLSIPHPLSGPLFVEGAEPGDILAVDLIGYESDDFGTTPIIPGFGFLADLFTEPYLVGWDIAGGVARSPELPGVAVPGDPFAGVVGVAPSSELLDALRSRERQIAERGGPVAEEAAAAVPPLASAGMRTIPPREIFQN